jgi:hypothetical protein
MAAEAAAGPQGVWQQQQQQANGNGNGRAAAAGSDSDADSAGEDAAAASDDDDEEEDDGEGTGLDPERLVLYERSKLRWFYAVVECDSADTAGAIYAACDGVEFERSASKFDLR